MKAKREQMKKRFAEKKAKFFNNLSQNAEM
jgi:hypothetical protein